MAEVSKVSVDAGECISCEACVDACAEVFEMGDDMATVSVDEVPAQHEETAQQAADECQDGYKLLAGYTSFLGCHDIRITGGEPISTTLGDTLFVTGTNVDLGNYLPGSQTHDGRVTANGLNGVPDNAGGGAGGSIYLTAKTLAGQGAILAELSYPCPYQSKQPTENTLQ